MKFIGILLKKIMNNIKRMHVIKIVKVAHKAGQSKRITFDLFECHEKRSGGEM